MRGAKPGLVLLYPANLAGAPGAFRGLHGVREAKPGGFQGLHGMRGAKPGGFQGLHGVREAKLGGFWALHGMREAKPGEFQGLHACAEQNPAGFGACTRARSKTRRVSGLARHARGKTRGGRGRQGRLPSFPGYLVATSPGPAGPLRQKIRGAPFLLCVGKRRPEGCSASASRRRDRATSYVEILLRCCYCPSAQNSFEAMR